MIQIGNVIAHGKLTHLTKIVLGLFLECPIGLIDIEIIVFKKVVADV